MIARAGSARPLFAAVFALSAVSLVAALVSQHVFDMQPCPWCVLQRLITVLIALAALLGWLWPAPAGRWTAALLIGVLAPFGAAAALWQHLVAAASSSCNLTLADRIVSGLQLDRALPEVFAATASCADAKVDLLGLPYEYWSLALFIVIDIAAVLAMLRRAPPV